MLWFPEGNKEKINLLCWIHGEEELPADNCRRHFLLLQLNRGIKFPLSMIPHYIIISVIIQSPQSRRFHRFAMYIKCPEKQRGQSGEAGRN